MIFLKSFILFSLLIGVVPKKQNITTKIPKQIIFTGPYYINVTSIEGCDETNIDKDVYNNVQLTYRVTEKSNNEFGGIVTIKRTIEILKGFYTVYMFKDGQFRSIFNRTTSTPCTDIILGSLITITVKMNFLPKCEIKMGTYNMNVTDLDSTVQKVIGKTFFYGKMKLIFGLYTERGFALCVNGVGELIPRTEKLPKSDNKIIELRKIKK